MNVVLTNKTVKCRKNHRCDWCGEGIESGESAQYTSGIYDSEFFSSYFHLECDDAMSRSDFSPDYEYDPMAQKRGKTLDESHA